MVLSLESFIPGKWSDNIDVNDFINLNKTPFNGRPDFIPENFVTKDLHLSLNNGIKFINDKPFKEKLINITYIEDKIKTFDFSEKKFDFSYGDKRSFNYFFNNTSTTSTKNLQSIGLLDNKIGSETPPLYFPDIRQLSLYGMKEIIKNKRSELRKFDGMFQTNNWVDKKIEKNREIEFLIDISRNNEYIPTNPTTDLPEILNGFLEIILLCIEENPTVTFHLPSLVNFLDIFIEKEIRSFKISEEYALEILFEFYMKLIFISEEMAERDVKFLIVETIFTKDPSKTTYRLLNLLKNYSGDSVSLTVVNDLFGIKHLESEIEALMFQGFDIKFLNSELVNEKSRPSISHLGFDYISDTDVILFNKNLDLKKLFFITLNGGKDIESNKNIYPVYMKFKKNEILYKNYMSELLKTTRFILSSFSETNNLMMYLADKYFYHPLRSSLKKQEIRYSFIFSFDNILELSRLILTIKKGKYELERDKNGFVTNILTDQSFEPEEVKDTMLKLSSMLYEEFQRLYFYQEGGFRLIFNINIPFDEDMIPMIDLPPSGRNLKFTTDEKINISNFDDVVVLNECGLLDFNTWDFLHI